MRRKSLSAITFSLLISLPAGCASTVPDDAPHIVVNVENGQAYGDHELLMNLLKDKAEKADIKMEFLETGHNGEDAETSLDKGADALLILADDWDESCETMAKAAIDHKIPLVCLIDSVVYDNEALRDTLQEQARCWDENGDMVSVIFSTSVSGIEQACAFLIQQGLDAADLNHDHVISLGVSEWTSGPFLSIPEKRFAEAGFETEFIPFSDPYEDKNVEAVIGDIGYVHQLAETGVMKEKRLVWCDTFCM